jgi:hypothetical protein
LLMDEAADFSRTDGFWWEKIKAFSLDQH